MQPTSALGKRAREKQLDNVSTVTVNRNKFGHCPLVDDAGNILENPCKCKGRRRRSDYLQADCDRSKIVACAFPDDECPPCVNERK